MLKQTPQEDIPADLASLIRIGTVLSVDLAEARCVVRFGDPDDPEPAQTGPIRWLSPRAGLTRVWSPPSEGEQVLLVCPDGQIGAAVAIMGIVQDAFPPLGSTTAEMIEFADGARITYDPEVHALLAVLPAGGTVDVTADGGITLRGDVTIEGNLAVSQTVTAEEDVIADGISLKSHKHGQVQAGSAQSGIPV
ncbi:MAG: phage baseplate assembly protein V [Erythrobacter sp.]|nr:phage baseplate assembly protein V [Erythrobacter sp.]MBA4079658.1 phage baseplate assembly protein V [Erythrobacter sp.]